MTVYVEDLRPHPDPMPQTPRQVKRKAPREYTYARLLPYPGDSLAEVQQLATALGIFLPPMHQGSDAYYCVNAKYRDKAIKLGAVPISRQAWFELRERALMLHYTICPECTHYTIVDVLHRPEETYCTECFESTGRLNVLQYHVTSKSTEFAQQLLLQHEAAEAAAND